MVYKLTVTLRDYQKVQWEAFGNKVASGLGKGDVVVEQGGQMLCTFYFETDLDESALRQKALEVFDQRGSNDKPIFNLSFQKLNTMDVEKLREPTRMALKEKGWKIEESASDSSAPRSTQPAPPASPASIGGTSPAEAIQRTIAAAAPVSREPARTESAPERTESAPVKAEGLLGVTTLIQSMTAVLLDKVLGQRHAVTELLQGLYESELVSKLDNDRRGPIGTFLFMGPSGVGKTYLATQFAKLAGRESLTVNMSEYSDNLSCDKFNGGDGRTAVVTSFVRKHPDGILIFDEMEKAHINTIHLFLQILDSGIMRDQLVGMDVSFKDTIVIMTTNVGRALYDTDSTTPLSDIPRNSLIEALRTERKPSILGDGPMFPESITTRMANGHIIMFNHLDPYSLLQIVQKEVQKEVGLYKETTGVEVVYDELELGSFLMYASGATTDARTLLGLTRNVLIKELQDVSLQLASKGPEAVQKLKKIFLTLDTNDMPEDVYNLFHESGDTQVLAFTASQDSRLCSEMFGERANVEVMSDPDAFKKKVRGVVDYILLDPFCGWKPGDKAPNDVEDIHSDGMDMYEYLREFFGEIPIYILDTCDHGNVDYSTLLKRGARSVLALSDDNEAFKASVDKITMNALIGNSVRRISRAGKFLGFNCAQYYLDDENVEICFSNLRIRTAITGSDAGVVTQRGENSDITFDDIVGCDDAKETLRKYAELLDNPRQGVLTGTKPPKGILLYGPPGTGKTMLAKAMANESNAMFLPISATSVFSKYVGETEETIRELFRKARRYAPSVIFVDEVDAFARQRTGGETTVHYESALNAFLAEMDGFVVDEKRPVFVMAATNYDISGDGRRVLDGAFVRRFDRRILIPLPDTDAREKLLTMSLKRHGIHFGDTHDSIVHSMAERTGGMSNADIEMLVEMYARSLADEEANGAKFLDALDKFRYGEIRDTEPEELRKTAYHEGGHALVSWICGDKPLFVTILSRGNYGGYMQTASDKTSYTFDELKNRVCCCLAGRAAEIEVYGESVGMNTGASSDIRQARYHVKACLADYAMGDKLYLIQTGKLGEEIMQEQFNRARKMIRDNRTVLDELVDRLVADKCIDQEAIDSFFSSRLTQI